MIIEFELYKKIREVIPTFCVDLVVINEKNQFLLCRRLEEPAKNQWWLPGGRLHKNESMLECARRKGKEEIGVNLTIGEFLSLEETIFHESNIHTVNAVFFAKFNKNESLNLDNTHIEYKWFNSIHSELNLHNGVKNPLIKAGYKITTVTDGL